MHRALRSLIIPFAVVTALGFAACSSDAGTSTTRSNSTPETTPDTTPVTTPVTTPGTVPGLPTDPDVALVSLGRPGDLVPRLVIGADGWVYFPTGQVPIAAEGLVAAPAAIPAPPAPAPVTRRKLTPNGLAAVVALAAEHHLFATPGPDDAPGVTDMETTRVILTDSTGEYVHDAYALGFEDETGSRADLLEFVDALGDIESLVGDDEIGPVEDYVPATFFVEVDGSYFDADGDTPWPTDVPVTEGCIDLPVASFPVGVAGLYTAADGGETVRVAVVPDLPGDDC